MAISTTVHCISTNCLGKEPGFNCFSKGCMDGTNQLSFGWTSFQRSIFGYIPNSSTPPFLVLTLCTFLHDIHNFIFN